MDGNGKGQRDIIVVGSSMGGIEALSALVAQLPSDLPASVLVVQHTSAESPGTLGEILTARGALPAAIATDGTQLEHGRIYVAPPDRHLLLTGSGLRVTFGARENRTRPAIDPLFRTAAVHHRSRVIGVVLTGMLGDGAAGLLAVHRCGGAAVVQDPDDAAYPQMPLRSLAAVPTARRAALKEMGPLLGRLLAEQAPAPPPVPEGLHLEVRLTERAMEAPDWHQLPGTSVPFTCPECKGAMHEIHEDGLRRYRCRVGHAYSAHDLVSDKAKAVEETLWMALQTLQERVQMLESLASDDRDRGHTDGPGSFGERARETREHADRLRELLAGLPQ